MSQTNPLGLALMPFWSGQAGLSTASWGCRTLEPWLTLHVVPTHSATTCPLRLGNAEGRDVSHSRRPRCPGQGVAQNRCFQGRPVDLMGSALHSVTPETPQLPASTAGPHDVRPEKGHHWCSRTWGKEPWAGTERPGAGPWLTVYVVGQSPPSSSVPLAPSLPQEGLPQSPCVASKLSRLCTVG